MPVHDAQRIGPGIAGNLDAEDEVVGIEILGVDRRDHLGIVEGGSGVHAHAAPDNLLEADVVLHALMDEAQELRIEGGEAQAEEIGEAVIRVILRMLLQPDHPIEPFVAGIGAGNLLQRFSQRRGVVGLPAHELDERRDGPLVGMLRKPAERLLVLSRHRRQRMERVVRHLLVGDGGAVGRCRAGRAKGDGAEGHGESQRAPGPAAQPPVGPRAGAAYLSVGRHARFSFFWPVRPR